ncbi:DUF3576 domain-containing protein [Pontivivens insulae]|uniref:DUF3576 domain-containing protein n=1 Tax=Pontivivens insulae TaxID=1639689 RepID=A0A2R8AF58_9RHOB|nr:DUF3576 domain-containing protein [Pontivivens insulae]RED11924.1 uncharacterized protein DUF3576 [Pontivivens insulae]SPF30680.1 hypothetical protein POI8812_03022 [Pontivivens insulae]
MQKSVKYLMALAAVAVIAGCDTLASGEAPGVPESANPERGINVAELLSGELAESAGPPLNVNSYMWRAALDTIDFLPIASSDPFGGVITTDWGTPSGSAAERFRATVFIQSAELSAGALNVSVFRQVNGGQGWVDAPVSASTVRQLEDAVLLRARELRREAAAAADN